MPTPDLADYSLPSYPKRSGDNVVGLSPQKGTFLLTVAFQGRSQDMPLLLPPNALERGLWRPSTLTHAHVVHTHFCQLSVLPSLPTLVFCFQLIFQCRSWCMTRASHRSLMLFKQGHVFLGNNAGVALSLAGNYPSDLSVVFTPCPLVGPDK